MAYEALPQFIEDQGGTLLLTAGASALSGLLAAQVLALRSAFQSPRFLDTINTFIPSQAEEIWTIADRVAEYIHGQGIGAVAIMDVAARPFYIPLRAAWRYRYDTAKDSRPPTFFVNPQGFRTPGAGIISPLKLAIKALIKGDKVESPHHMRSRSRAKSELPHEQPGLYAHQEQPVLLLDTCLHSGSSALPVIKGLKRAGFRDVRLGVIYQNKHFRWWPVSPDVIFSEKAPTGGCYPVGFDRLVEKTYASTRSRRALHPARVAAARYLRTNLRQAIDAAIQWKDEGDWDDSGEGVY